MATHSATHRHGPITGDSAAEQAFYKERGFLPAPRLVQWFATLRCALRCEHCLAACGDAGGDMPLATALILVDQVAEMGVAEFLITGGEPLLREDLPTIIERLASRKVRYSVNTAISPSPAIRAAMREYPPMFAAVSLDGPAEIHDACRGRAGAFAEAMEALRFFADLPGCHVAAGTTVTTANYAALTRTFHLVTESPADHWGIHLLIPEGRAADRPDLFLSRKQLKDLLAFAARKRQYFPVQLADEIGYCGDMEPLLRDTPFRCGAGRAQCVVLPSGDVVPCTTLDRSVSAGNLSGHSLADIWREGFTELRQWQPKGRCGACEYAPACGGGCWLQRRQGTHCAKDVWLTPSLARSTAGLAICLGLLPGAQAMAETPQPGPASTPVRTSSERPDGTSYDNEMTPGLERVIVGWYARQLPGARHGSLREGPPSPGAEAGAVLALDCAYAFFAQMKSGDLPKDLPGLEQEITKAIATKQRSMAFAALLWRSVAEWCMANPVAARTPEQQELLRKTLAAIHTAATRWQREIVTAQLDPYLNRGRTNVRYAFEVSKAMPAPAPWLDLVRKANRDRWGTASDPEPLKQLDPANAQAIDGFLARHPWAGGMQLKLAAELGAEEAQKGKTSLGICDVLTVGETPKTIRLVGPSSYRPGEAKPSDSTSYTVELPAKTEFTYVDLLMLTYAQHASRLDTLTTRSLPAEPILLGAVKSRLAAETAATRPVNSHTFPLPQHQALALWMADFWMF